MNKACGKKPRNGITGQCSQFSRNRCAEIYCQSPSHYTSAFNSLPHLLMPALSFQWIWFEEPCSSSLAHVLLAFLLGSLGGRWGDGGGGILQGLTWKKLLEDRVHLTTDVLKYEANNVDVGERTKRSLFFHTPTLNGFRLMLSLSVRHPGGLKVITSL